MPEPRGVLEHLILSHSTCHARQIDQICPTNPDLWTGRPVHRPVRAALGRLTAAATVADAPADSGGQGRR